MFDKLILYFVLILFIYSALFVAYFAFIVLAAIFKRNENKHLYVDNEYKNLVIIIYSHNNERTVVNLLEQLNKQDYPQGNYQTHIILDNCTDNSSNKLEFVGGAKLWRLKDDEPLGKDKAISWLLENIMSFKNIDAYVFLNANRMVKTDFLKNVNSALQENDVVVGATEIFLDNANYSKKVWANVNEYNAGIMKPGRTNLGLAVPIDSDITIIKHDILEKVEFIDFKDANSELKYSFLLTKIGFVPRFAPEVKTYVSSSDYVCRKPDFSFKMSLFFHCFNFQSLTNFRFLEFLFSLFKPNPIILAASLVIVSVYSFNYYFLNDFPWAIFLGFVLAMSFGISLYMTNMYYLKQLIYLASYPFFTLLNVLYGLKIFKNISKNHKDKDTEDIKTERIFVPVCVTNGRNDFSCNLELISDGGFKKAVFHYKNKKKGTAQSYVRMCDAVKDIVNRIEQHGFKIKICQSCAYFSPQIDGTDNMIKGYCNRTAVSNNEYIEPPETILWHTCENFIPQEINNIIDISKFIKK